MILYGDIMNTKLNLGAGGRCLKDHVNLDIIKYDGIDVVWNLEETPLPFQDETFEEVRAYNVLEHIENFIPLMEELHRIMKKGAILKIVVPYYNSKGAFQDPTHRRFFTEETFLYFTNNKKIPNYRFKCNFKLKTLKLEYRVKFIEIFPEKIRKILRMLFCNLVKSIYIELEK
jgi:SAM-dependent methyltransferase